MIPVLKKKDWFHPDGFPIEVARRDPQEPFGIHAHDFSEIVIVTSGSGLHITGTESWVLAAGDAFVIGGSQPHDYQDMCDLHLINILFDPPLLQMPSLDLPVLPGHHALFKLEPAWRRRHQFKSRLRLSPRDLAHAEGIIDQLEDELKRRDAGFRFMATAHFMQLAGFLSRCYSEQDHPDSQALLRIAETIAYLEHNYHEEISLDELAEMAHMSRRSFIRAFNAATGNPPIAHVIQLRVHKAAELLRREDVSVTEAAFRVGFSDGNYFTRQFRKLLGVPPSKYRAQYACE